MRNAVKRNWIHWAKGLAKDPEDPRMHLPRATKSGRSSTGVPGCLDECHELSVLTCSGPISLQDCFREGLRQT